MDHLSRVIVLASLLLVAAACLLAPSRAEAYGRVTPGTSTQNCYKTGGFPSSNSGCPTASESCDAYAIAQKGASNYHTFNVEGANACRAAANQPAYNSGNWVQSTAIVAYTAQVAGCPANSASDPLVTGPSGCLCNPGYRDNAFGDACVAYACGNVQPYLPGLSGIATDADVYQNTKLGGDLCYAGCTISGQRSFKAADGRFWTQGPFVFGSTGQAVGSTVAQCEDRAPDDPAASDATVPNKDAGPTSDRTNQRNGNTGLPSTCPKNQCPGTVNGASVCVACSVSQAVTETQAASSPNGAASAPPIAGAPAGTASATTITSCQSGMCTTTTTYYSSSGSVLGTNQTNSADTSSGTPGGPSGTGKGSGDGDSQSSFGGSCGGGFTCSGDAIQCAIARDQYARNCTVFDTATAVSNVGNAAYASGLQGDTDHPNRTGSSSALTFDSTDIVAGACPTDLSITVPHFSNVVVPFSQLCTPAGWLGNLLVGLTALACVGIVFVRGGGA